VNEVPRPVEIPSGWKPFGSEMTFGKKSFLVAPADVGATAPPAKASITPRAPSAQFSAWSTSWSRFGPLRGSRQTVGVGLNRRQGTGDRNQLGQWVQ